MKREKLFLITQIKEVSYINTKLLKVVGSDYEVPFPTESTNGNHNLKNCQGCKDSKEHLASIFTKRFAEFPNCCKNHKRLNKASFFNKDDFGNFPEYTANKVLYSYHHIINNLDANDWYNDIIDYLEYTIESFGSLPKGYGYPFQLDNYFHLLKKQLNNVENDLKSDKISMIEIKTRVNKVKNLLEITTESSIDNETDLNLLLSTYQNWYKIFPFDLPYFKPLKKKYSRILPLFTGKHRYNKYLKIIKNEVHTKESLTVVLFQITKDITNNINGLSFYNKGKLENAKNIELKLILEKRKLQLLDLSKLHINKKSDYIKVLKKWLKDEKEFITDIVPHLPKQKDYSFINLFKSKELYKKAINVLKNNGFITENNDALNWVFVETKKYKTTQTLIALCVVLEVKQYFKPRPRGVYNYLEYEFEITMNKSTYSRSSDGFKDDYENEKSTNYKYTSLFKDIL